MVDFCRDWQTTIRPASYRGVPFFVETDGLAGGRRLVIHEAPHVDDPYVEDLGRKPRTINVTAYIVGDDIERQAKRLMDACEAGGPANLELTFDRFKAHCQDAKRDRNKDRMGYMGFSLTFVREGQSFGPIAILGLARAIEFGVGALVPSLAGAFQSTFATLGAPAYVLREAANHLTGFFADFSAQARLYPVAPLNLARALQVAGDSIDGVDSLVSVGAIGDRWTGTTFTETQANASGADLVGAVVAVFDQAGAGLTGLEHVQFMAEWIDWGDAAGQTIGAGSQRIIDNSIALNNLVRATALSRYAAAVTQRAYTDRREARQAKADAAEFFDFQMMQLSGWENFAVWKELSNLRGQVSEHLHRVITDLAPVLVIEAQKRMPALWWSQRLYGTAARADELVERNGIKNAAFMPIEFEAASR